MKCFFTGGVGVNVTIKLFATLRNGRFKIAERKYPEGTTVAEIVDGLAIPRQEIASILVNGLIASYQQELHDKDTLVLFPLLGGG
jgi:molybdopterin converting factor small subunit